MKRFLSILLALVMVLSLVACGNKTTPDTPDTPDKQEESSSTVRGTSPS